jgi:hypothetical protein
MDISVIESSQNRLVPCRESQNQGTSLQLRVLGFGFFQDGEVGLLLSQSEPTQRLPIPARLLSCPEPARSGLRPQ